MASQFQDFRKPVVYILEQELRKRDLKNKVKISGTGTESSSLPMYPMQLIRDSEGKKVVKCVHGTAGQQWTEEFIRDSTEKVYQILITYPDSSTNTIQLYRNPKVYEIDKL